MDTGASRGRTLDLIFVRARETCTQRARPPNEKAELSFSPLCIRFFLAVNVEKYFLDFRAMIFSWTSHRTYIYRSYIILGNR